MNNNRISFEVMEKTLEDALKVAHAKCKVWFGSKGYNLSTSACLYLDPFWSVEVIAEEAWNL
jgi:hypothetical protein